MELDSDMETQAKIHPKKSTSKEKNKSGRWNKTENWLPVWGRNTTTKSLGANASTAIAINKYFVWISTKIHFYIANIYILIYL